MPTVVSVNVMHQKIVVIDELTVLPGRLNSLSQSRSREVMLTIRGGHFARKILAHEHAEDSRDRPGAARAKIGLHDLDLHRVWAARAPENVASAKTLLRAGMTEEGRIRHHVYVRGAWRDSVIHAAVNGEWLANTDCAPLEPR